MLKPRVPALEAEVARLQGEVQDRNKGLRDAQNEEMLARTQVPLVAPITCEHVIGDIKPRPARMMPMGLTHVILSFANLCQQQSAGVVATDLQQL